MRGGRFQRTQHARGAAGVDTGVGLRRGQQGSQVGALALGLGVHHQTLAVARLERGQQGHVGTAAAAVVQHVVAPQRLRALRHGGDGGDADTAGNKDQLQRAFVQAKVVARPAHAQRGAFAQVVVHPGRAAPAGLVAQHGDLERVRVGRVAAQRVLARQAGVAALDVDVRARLPARQRRAVRADQAQLHHVIGQARNALHHQGARDGVARRLANAHRLFMLQQGGLGAFGVVRRIPFHPQVLGAAKRCVGHIAEGLLSQLHVRQASGEFLQEDLHFHARQVLAHALVRAVAKGQVVAGVVPADVQQVGVGEVPLVVVGGRGDDQQLAAGRDVDAADLRVGRHQPAPGRHRAVVAQALFHRVGDQAGVFTDVAPHLRVLQQQLHGVGGGVGRGFVRGDDAGHHHRVQVRVGHHLGVFALLAQAVLHPAGRLGVLPHLVQNLPRQLPEVAHGVRHGHLLLRLGPAPGVDGVGNAVLAQLVHVFLGHTQEMQRHRQRHFPEHLVHQISAAFVDEAVHILARQLAHQRLVRLQLFGRERRHQHAAARHVGRLVLVDQGAVQRKAVLRQHGVGLRAGGRDLFQRYGWAEGDVVAKDGLDVVVARDHPVAQPGAVEDRFLLARPAHVLGRVLLIAIGKGVERGRARAHGAAGGATQPSECCVIDGAARF